MTNGVKSPCINVCRYNEKKECLGCGRTPKEIEEWYSASENRKMKILESCNKRKLDRELKKDIESLTRIFKTVNKI